MEKEIDYDKELQRLERMIKERETSVLRAAKTFTEDLLQYRSGKSDEFPYPAFTGLVFAYLRPRLVLAIGGIFAALFTIIQVYILLNQNEIIERQNVLMEEQTKAANQQTVSLIVSRLDPDNIEATTIVLSELTELGDLGVNVVLNIAESNSARLKPIAIRHLVHNTDKYSLEANLRLLHILFQQLEMSIDQFLNPETQDRAITSANFSPDFLEASIQKVFAWCVQQANANIFRWDTKNEGEFWHKTWFRPRIESIVGDFYSYVDFEYGWKRIISPEEKINVSNSKFFSAIKYTDLWVTDYCLDGEPQHPDKKVKKGIKFFMPGYSDEISIATMAVNESLNDVLKELNCRYKF